MRDFVRIERRHCYPPVLLGLLVGLLCFACSSGPKYDPYRSFPVFDGSKCVDTSRKKFFDKTGEAFKTKHWHRTWTFQTEESPDDVTAFYKGLILRDETPSWLGRGGSVMGGRPDLESYFDLLDKSTPLEGVTENQHFVHPMIRNKFAGGLIYVTISVGPKVEGQPTTFVIREILPEKVRSDDANGYGSEWFEKT